ncbi:hypothetical protein V8C35DRAFT_299784 [Trichoderma chlorosporum]
MPSLWQRLGSHVLGLGLSLILSGCSSSLIPSYPHTWYDELVPFRPRTNAFYPSPPADLNVLRADVAADCSSRKGSAACTGSDGSFVSCPVYFPFSSCRHVLETPTGDRILSTAPWVAIHVSLPAAIGILCACKCNAQLAVRALNAAR